jgi:hypothetical protein
MCQEIRNFFAAAKKEMGSSGSAIGPMPGATEPFIPTGNGCYYRGSEGKFCQVSSLPCILNETDKENWSMYCPRPEIRTPGYPQVNWNSLNTWGQQYGYQVTDVIPAPASTGMQNAFVRYTLVPL